MLINRRANPSRVLSICVIPFSFHVSIASTTAFHIQSSSIRSILNHLKEPQFQKSSLCRPLADHQRQSPYQCNYRSDTGVHAAAADDASTTDCGVLPENSQSRRQRKDIPKWITCSTTKELICAIEDTMQPHDVVAELGSQLRDVSTAICTRAKSAVLVDVTRRFPKSPTSSSSNRAGNIKELSRTKAMRRPDDEISFYTDMATFHEIPFLDNWRSVFMSATVPSSTLNSTSINTTPEYTVLVLDVNVIVGNDLEWTSLSILREFTSLYPSCKTILVKSESLNRWSSRIIHGQRWVDGLELAATQQMSQGSSSAVMSPKIIATVGVDQYRATIDTVVQPGDSVLEVGSHFGTTTTLLQDRVVMDDSAAVGYAIGVDVGSSIIRSAQKRFPNVYFAKGNAWKTAELLRIQQAYLQHDGIDVSTNAERQDQRRRTIGFDVVYVDVGGLSGQYGLLEALELLSSLQNALEPKCIVIKSMCVRKLASSLRPYWKQRKQQQQQQQVSN